MLPVRDNSYSQPHRLRNSCRPRRSAASRPGSAAGTDSADRRTDNAQPCTVESRVRRCVHQRDRWDTRRTPDHQRSAWPSRLTPDMVELPLIVDSHAVPELEIRERADISCDMSVDQLGKLRLRRADIQSADVRSQLNAETQSLPVFLHCE